MANATIRCELVDNKGCFTRTFDRTTGWQQEIRSWVNRLKDRFDIAGATLRMYPSKDGYTYTTFKSVPVN